MIAKKTFREIWLMALVYALLMEVLQVPIILLWPDLYGDLQKSALLKNAGFDFLQRIGTGVTDKQEEVAYRNWIAVMLFLRSVNLLGLAASVLMGTALFARERETQTLEFLLARPVSRASILWQKWWPTMLCVVVPIFVVNTTAILWSWRIDLDLPLGPLTLANLHGSLFALAVLALTVYVSIRCRVQAHVAFWVGGIVVLQLGIYLVPRWRAWSLFRLSDFDWYGPILAGNLGLAEMFVPGLGPAYSLWLLLAILVFGWLSLRSLQRLELG